MCVQWEVFLWNGRPCGSGTSVFRSCLPGQQTLGGELWRSLSQTAGSGHDQPDQRYAGPSRTTGSVDGGVGGGKRK